MFVYHFLSIWGYIGMIQTADHILACFLKCSAYWGYWGYIGMIWDDSYLGTLSWDSFLQRRLTGWADHLWTDPLPELARASEGPSGSEKRRSSLCSGGTDGWMRRVEIIGKSQGF